MSLQLKIKPFSEEIADMYNKHGHYHEGDAGLDLFITEDVVVPAKSLGFFIGLGISCELGQFAYQGFIQGEDVYTSLGSVSYLILPRSSISKTPLRLSNSIGLIDAGYRGELMVALDNHYDQDYELKKGDRLVQLVPKSDSSISEIIIVDELSKTTRGSGGFGSTGK